MLVSTLNSCKRVGEGQRHVDVGEAVVVVTAVEQIVGRVARTAGDRYRLGTVEALAARVRAIALVQRCAGDRDQFCRIAAVQRQFDDAILINHLRIVFCCVCSSAALALTSTRSDTEPTFI